MNNPEKTPQPPVPPHVESDDWARVPSIETPLTGAEIDDFLGQKAPTDRKLPDEPTDVDDQTQPPEDGDEPRTDWIRNFSFKPTDDEPGDDNFWKDLFGIKK